MITLLWWISAFVVAMLAKSAWKYTVGPTVDRFFAGLVNVSV